MYFVRKNEETHLSFKNSEKQRTLNLKHVIPIIANREIIYFSRTNHYLFKEPQALKLH